MINESIDVKINNIKRAYLDVSIITNPYFKEYLMKSKIVPYISDLTLLELKSYKMYDNVYSKKEIDKVLENTQVLKINDKILKMAKEYIKKGAIQKEKYNEALHFAIARYYNCSIILYDKSVLDNKKIDFQRILG